MRQDTGSDDLRILLSHERVDDVKKGDYFTKCSSPARKVLESVLDKYAD